MWFPLIMALFASKLSTVHAMSKEAATATVENDEKCICDLLERPDMMLKEKRARWMVHSLEFGVLSTISTRFPDSNTTPFGNIYSFVDGSCDSSTGIPYFYSTALDQTYIDIQSNAKASFSLTEASLSSVCSVQHGLKSCSTNGKYGDPENPMCARLTLTGTLVEVTSTSDEYSMARTALFQRHPSMATWPENHKWIILKLVIDDIWFIDYFGGATIMSVDEYFSTELFSSITEEAH
jgi:Pyridoxamine 5'-phosphate oxidase